MTNQRTGASDVPASARRLAGPVCFARGTRILTDDGEVAVEDLSPGACAVTLGGALQLVVWVGRRRIDLRRHPQPQSAAPVRVRRGALGNGVPARDLLLSPDHALFLHNALLPARLLVNGATIVQDLSCRQVEYFHVALQDHSILLADGAPAESLPAHASRAGFSGSRVTTLHPDFAAPPPTVADAALDCARRLDSGPVAQEARRTLLARARALGHAITRDPDLHLLADGVRIDPTLASSVLYRFVPPSAASDIRIVCRAGVPAEIDPASDDRRRLGVMLARAVLRSGSQTFEIGPASPLLRDGFHDPERDGGHVWRWTDGHARLPLPVAGVTRIELHILGAQPSWARAGAPGEPAQRGG